MPRPQVIHQIADLRRELDVVRRQGKSIGLVPTMGALHQGHLSLVDTCREECDWTVVSIFVNPSQFGPGEDLAKYPRTLDADLDALADRGVEVAFVPAADEIYRPGHDTWVEVGAVAEPMEGRRRPGHFRGVATIVLKLFGMVGPDLAYFGQKDFQQALVIRRMVEDLDVPVEIRVCPTVREQDGLAMSSRNAHLDPEARRDALTLRQALQAATQMVEQGERDTRTIAEQMRRIIAPVEGAKIDYIALVDPETLEPVETIRGPTLAALAVNIGGTWLLDNCLLADG